MKIKTTVLKTAIDNLSRITGRKVSLPILACVKIVAENNTLTLRASNLDEDQTEIVECEGSLPEHCVSLRLLSGALGSEEMDVTLDGTVLRVDWNENHFSIPVPAAEEFPGEPNDKFTNISVPCADLAESIKAVAWCASQDASRYALQDVHVAGKAKKLRCEATTGRELAVCEMDLLSAEFEALIPSEFAANVALALSREESVFAVGEKMISVTHKSGFYLCKQTDAVYPNAAHVQPEKTNEIGTCKVVELKELFSRCNFYDNQKTPGASLTFSKTGLAVKFSGNSELDLRMAGKFARAKISVNAESFFKILSNIPGDEVLISVDASFDDGIVVLESGDLRVFTTQYRIQ